MGEVRIIWRWMTGEVDVSKAPPAVTLKGYSPLPGEGWQEYGRRIERALLGGESASLPADSRGEDK